MDFFKYSVEEFIEIRCRKNRKNLSDEMYIVLLELEIGALYKAYKDYKMSVNKKDEKMTELIATWTNNATANTKTAYDMLSKLTNKIKELAEERVALIEHRMKFIHVKYDHRIFGAATIRYGHASKINKTYPKCLLDELKKQKKIKRGFEDTEEFWDMCNAYKQYRSDVKKVRSTLPKK